MYPSTSTLKVCPRMKHSPRALSAIAALLLAVPISRGEESELPLLIPFAQAGGTLLLEPVTLLESYIGLTLEPQPVVVKVRDQATQRLVKDAPVSFEITASNGTLSLPFEENGLMFLETATDSETGEARVMYHPSPQLDLPGAITASAFGKEVMLLFWPLPPPIAEAGASEIDASGMTGAAADGVTSLGGVGEGFFDDGTLNGSENPLDFSDLPPGLSAEMRVIVAKARALERNPNRTLIVFTPLEG